MIGCNGFKHIIGVWMTLAVLGVAQAEPAAATRVASESSGNKMTKTTEAKAKETGKFILQFGEVKKDKELQGVKDLLQKESDFENVVTAFNDSLLLPENVTIIFEEAGSIQSPYYNRGTNEVHYGYEFVVFTVNLYNKLIPDAGPEELRQHGIDITHFFLLHELGHALIDIYELPVVGDEETPVDILAALIAMEFNTRGLDIVLSGVIFFDAFESLDPEITAAKLWDEHALNPQRVYNLLCLAYGKMPEQVTDIIKESGVKELQQFIDERKDFCLAKYPTQYNLWLKLLKPHLRKE
jgi:hypothetical protein